MFGRRRFSDDRSLSCPRGAVCRSAPGSSPGPRPPGSSFAFEHQAARPPRSPGVAFQFRSPPSANHFHQQIGGSSFCFAETPTNTVLAAPVPQESARDPPKFAFLTRLPATRRFCRSYLTAHPMRENFRRQGVVRSLQSVCGRTPGIGPR